MLLVGSHFGRFYIHALTGEFPLARSYCRERVYAQLSYRQRWSESGYQWARR